MRTKLTDISIRNLPHPESGSVKYWDTVTSGFGVRVTSRSKSFFVMFGKERRLKTLGAYPQKSLSDARKDAKRYLVLNPEKNAVVSLTDARKDYLEECEAKNRVGTIKFYTRILNLIDDKPLPEIKKSDIDISDPHKVMVWKIFFNWCLRNDLVERNPFLGIPVNYGKRDRVLTNDEIKKLWNYEHKPFSDIVKVLILTGCRLNEVFHFEEKEDCYYLPAERAKNNNAHTIPKTDLLASYLPLPSFNGWSKAKRRIDKETKVTEWKLHDIRRTYATLHAKIGTPVHIVERLLNHVGGSISGVARIYNRYDYMQEAKIAVEKYEQHIQTITA